jgi:hypothetical protein
MAGHGPPGSLDLARSNAFRLHRLKTERTKIERTAALGLTVDTALMGLPVF